MTITDNIHAISLLGNRVYLITGKKLILIDTGLPYHAKHIVRYIKKIGRSPDELTLIVLTHHHIDHRGSARALQALTGAVIAAHHRDAPFIEGKRKAFTSHPRRWVRLLHFITDLIFQKETVFVDHILEDGDTIHDLTVIHTPGHTPGSISLFHRKTGALFCGDTVPYTLGKLRRPNPYTIDHEQEMLSIKKLAAIDCQFLLPNDCRMVLGNPQAILRDFCSMENEE